MRYLSAGEFPEWKLYIQTMEVEDELKFDFDPLDASKIFPEDQFPLQPVGRMVLDRNIDNFFNEQEMVAFNPGVTPPGLLLTPEHSVPQCVCGFLPNPVILCCVPDQINKAVLCCAVGCSHCPAQGAACPPLFV